jgi:hypothetical protein
VEATKDRPVQTIHSADPEVAIDAKVVRIVKEK